VIRKSVWPMREILNRLESMEPNLLARSMRIYFRNLYEHIIYIVDLIETLRDILGSTFDIYLSNQGNKLNNIVKTLTIISVIFTPLNLIASFFGMNWMIFPYTNDPYPYVGFFSVIAAMVIIAVVLFKKFKKKAWF
nr:CorA family divalent cation transporter [Candidatus Sigynarchaeota archaeon]